MKSILKLLVAIIVIALLIVTCPDETLHKEKISQSLNEYVQDEIDQQTDSNNFANLIGGLLADKIINGVVDSQIKVDNFFIFSIGKINIDGKERPVSFGILGHVFTFDKEDLKSATSNLLK